MRRAPAAFVTFVQHARRNRKPDLRTKFFAMTYDRQIAGAEKAGLRAFRERLLAGASGDVVEIGGGTGA